MSRKDSYSKVLKSASMVGGSQFIKILIGIAQTKVAALLLGPTGIGIIGAYQSIINLCSHISSFGINKSGVRDVSLASGSNDLYSLSRTVNVLRKMCWITGLSGLFIMAALSYPISKITFGNVNHAVGILFLSSIIFFTSITQEKLAVIQGLRRIADLVRLQIYGSLSGAAISIVFYYFWGLSAIVPSLISVSIFNLIAALWFSRNFSFVAVTLDFKQTISHARSLFSLGSAFMISGLSVTFTAYAVRTLISRDIGIDGLGMYQAAFAISGHAFSFILGSMGVDFYPRLTAVFNDHNEMSRLINEQTEIGLLLATPTIIALFGFSSFIITLLYTSDFYPAVELLRWFALGSFFKVISWPLDYVQLSLGKQYWYMSSQLFFNVLHILLIFLCVHIWGLPGAAIAFFITYALYVVAMKLLAGYLIAFTWSKETKKLILFQVVVVFSTFFGLFFICGIFSTIFMLIIFSLLSLYSLRQVLFKIGTNHRLYISFTKIPYLKNILGL